jgi:hypothetical protein
MYWWEFYQTKKGKFVLSKINNKQFQQLVFSVMAINSILMLWQQGDAIALFVWHKLATINRF